MPSVSDIRRLDFGYFVRPPAETGTGRPRFEPCLGYLVRLPDGCLLFDTGMGIGPAELEAHYHPVRHSLREALRAVDAALDDIRWVMNCHLHFDHCGANPSLPGRPIFTQAAELAAARSQADYTLPHLIDFPGVRYEELHGGAELWPGIHVIPTPGHTDGHQSLVLRCQDGTVVLLGQAHHSGGDFTSDYLARQARQYGIERLSYSVWLDRLTDFDPARVFFAHDLSVWEPAKIP